MSRIVSGRTGLPLLCCWTECDRLGDDRYETIVREPRRLLHYVFCSERHKMLWAHSHKRMNNLPGGSKSLLAPK